MVAARSPVTLLGTPGAANDIAWHLIGGTPHGWLVAAVVNDGRGSLADVQLGRPAARDIHE